MSPSGKYTTQEARDLAAREAALDIIEAATAAMGKCCARCARGTRAHGVLRECGYGGKCQCHRKTKEES